MAQLTVRNVPKETALALKIRAAKHGRSAEAELRLILEQALRAELTDWWKRAEEARKRTAGTPQTDSAILVREMRDER